MTEITKVECYGDLISVDLDRDGALTFVGFDPNYARAMQEFGEPVSPCENLLLTWQNDRRVFIVYKCGIMNAVLLNFANDCIDHYIHVIGADSRALAILENAVESIRAFIWGYTGLYHGLESTVVEDLVKKLNLAHGSTWDLENDRAYSSIAYSAGKAIMACLDMIEYDEHLKCIQRKLDPYVYSDYKLERIESKIKEKILIALQYETKDEYESEVLWQLRRFADVIDAINQGKPWPPVEATE